ncbi:MAG: DUF2851 domain-containing protein [Bacteroidetes bacterium]|nr:MAG: DUF2851 domain-containing protein [Bacteroidota bacterium]
MTERLLQFIWKMQYFNSSNLETTDRDSLYILYPGIWNSHQGPDFKDARIRLNQTPWAGNIELHLKSSHWNLHKHSEDWNYDNIILHVVWENDMTIFNVSGNPIPTLELQDKVSKLLLEKYEELMKSKMSVPCAGMLLQVEGLTWTSWKERLLIERLIHKSGQIENHLMECNNHWEEVFWWTIAKNFGMHQNSESFEAIARSIPLKILIKHKKQIHQLEAFLLGQAGLLEKNFEDKYAELLRKEYQFLKEKYQLHEIQGPIHFLRMRPGNFPSIRLAQLAMLIHQSSHLFAKIRESDSLQDVKDLFSVTANDYWHYRYTMDEPSPYKPKTLGKQMVDSLIINTIVPVLFAYGNLNNCDLEKQRALQWLQATGPETNTITDEWKRIGVHVQNASDSQALLELFHSYCEKKKCLDCAIGNAMLRITLTN